MENIRYTDTEFICTLIALPTLHCAFSVAKSPTTNVKSNYKSRFNVSVLRGTTRNFHFLINKSLILIFGAYTY